MHQCINKQLTPTLIMNNKNYLLEIYFSDLCYANYIFLFYINTNKNMKTRNREFNEVRNQNLAKSAYNPSVYSNFNPTSRQQNTANNQSFTSSFIKKAKPDVCVTCVNKKIVNEKKEKDTKNKMKEIQQYKAQLQYRNAQKDAAKEYRSKMLKQASQYNKKLIGSHQRQAKSEKLQDTRYISELIQKEQKEFQLQRQHLEQQKQRTLKYRKELYLQYKNQEQKKIQEKMEQKKPQINQLNLKYYDKSNMVKEYSTELKKQINNSHIKKLTEREKQIQEEKKFLQISEKQFLKYTEFLKHDTPSQSINPEVFEDLKLMDYTKKIKKIEERQMKNKQREEQLNRERELYKSQTERSLKLKRDYERELKQQMTQKYLKAATEKEEERIYPWREEKYTEDIAKQSRIIKPCQQCCHEYDEKYMI